MISTCHNMISSEIGGGQDGLHVEHMAARLGAKVVQIEMRDVTGT
jgi:pyruvate/2-oxoglutarate dehydrogenase complex dihydrolipoamide dehydrogenase (E3) component